MFSYADDGGANALLLFTSGGLDPKDLERYLEAVTLLGGAIGDRRDAAVILVLDDGAPTPPPTWRKAMAEATRAIRARPVRAIVSPSSITRSIATAISWLRRESPFEAETVVSTFAEAVVWVEARRGDRRVIFERLLSEARARTRSH